MNFTTKSKRQVGDFKELNIATSFFCKRPSPKLVINLVSLCRDGFTENPQKLREFTEFKILNQNHMFMVHCKI